MWPVSGPPITDGAIIVDDRGRLSAVGSEPRIPHPESLPSYSAPDAVLLPGLINAHSHLELTHLRGAVPDPEFYEWIQHIRREKSQATPEVYRRAACDGVREMWAAGITTVADTGDSGAAAEALNELGGRGIVYQEVFGPHPDQADEAIRQLEAAVERLRRHRSPLITIGVSPHAPYTVSPPLFRRVAAYARAGDLPLAVHLAESPAEAAFITAGAGPFAELWRRRGVPLPPPAVSPVMYLDHLGVLQGPTLVIHGVQVAAPDIDLLAQRGVAVVLCPRSNRRHGHGFPPVDGYRKGGVPLAVGSDSAASVDQVDLFAEAAALVRDSSVDAEGALRMLTLEGAAALGLDREVGSLEAGKAADLCLLDVEPGGSAAGLAARVLAASPASVRATWVAGRLVHGSWPDRRQIKIPPR